MKNVVASVNKNLLTIEVDLGKNYGPSGKYLTIATTDGGQPTPAKGIMMRLLIQKKVK